jgi:hypothetical protein
MVKLSLEGGKVLVAYLDSFYVARGPKKTIP